MRDLPVNPFVPGAGNRPPALTGRDPELERFGTVLDRLGHGVHDRSLVISGLRGVGKTVLLNEYDAISKERGWFSSGVIEVREDHDLASLIANAAYRALRKMSRQERMRDRARRALGVLKAFSLTAKGTDQIGISIDVDATAGTADSGDVETDVVELLVELGEVATVQGRGVVFLLDELQFLHRNDLGLLAAALHQLGQQNAPVVMAAAGLPQLPLLFLQAKPYAERLFTYRTIGSLPEPAARAAFTIPAERSGLAFEADALALLLEKTDGYPYFIQQWGQGVWDLADDTITKDDVHDAEPSVHEELDTRFFRDRYDKATEAERIYMAAMADLGDGAHPSGGIAAHMGYPNTRAVSVRRDSLIKKGLIYSPRGTELDFTVPHFADFMRRTHPFDRNERPRRGRPRAPAG
jgi:hypothetical protein